MKVERFLDYMGDRYKYDFSLCSSAKGYAQVDTGQDASYFGTWANPQTLKIVCYCEGDVTIQTAESADEFAATIRGIRDWNEQHGHGFKGIDGMCRPEIIAGFEALGLGDLLY